MWFLVPRFFVLAATCVSLSACTHFTPAGSTNLVVIGQIDTLSSASLDEWGLNVMFTGDLKITRVLRGKAPRSSLPVRYIAHTEYPSSMKTKFRLQRAKNGDWLVCRHGSGRGYICR